MGGVASIPVFETAVVEAEWPAVLGDGIEFVLRLDQGMSGVPHVMTVMTPSRHRSARQVQLDWFAPACKFEPLSGRLYEGDRFVEVVQRDEQAVLFRPPPHPLVVQECPHDRISTRQPRLCMRSKVLWKPAPS